MRLLNVETKRLERFEDEANTPPYAILSHTWGRPEEEISFDDLQDSDRAWLQSDSDKSIGWTKLNGTCKRAQIGNYRYVWIDTCCIDRSSSAELQEAINSMFRWYSQAAICFAYLSDVSDLRPEDVELESSKFRKSRWFTRGWTLQELLAPGYIIFYDSDWKFLGTTVDFRRSIAEITGVPYAYISHSQDLSKASVAERMSWASRRETTRAEDLAYCLLGIFDVQMPILYGEGMRAFARLQQEIMKLTDDTSLLAWGLGQLSDLQSLQGLPSQSLCRSTILAPSPSFFRHCGDLRSHKLEGFKRPSFSMSQQGFFATLPIRRDVSFGNIAYAVLHCGSCHGEGDAMKLIAFPLVSTQATSSCEEYAEDDYFVRPLFMDPFMVSSAFLDPAEVTDLVILRSSQDNNTFKKLNLGFPVGAWPSKPDEEPRLSLLNSYPPQPTRGCLLTFEDFAEDLEVAASDLEPWNAILMQIAVRDVDTLLLVLNYTIKDTSPGDEVEVFVASSTFKAFWSPPDLDLEQIQAKVAEDTLEENLTELSQRQDWKNTIFDLAPKTAQTLAVSVEESRGSSQKLIRITLSPE